MYNLMGLNSTAATNQPNVSCTCNCKRSLFQSMEIKSNLLPRGEVEANSTDKHMREEGNRAELEFVQIIVIVVVMIVMVVVITCLLNHYKLSTRSLITRQSQMRRQEGNLQSHQIYTPRTTDRLTVPSFLHRDRFSRFQPTYPYMQHEIDLPPTISLSDGEEPPPYQGPCTLQLRDPEQQMELNRESVRAPPNRTIFDSDLIDTSIYNAGPCPPSCNSGVSATSYSSNGRMEGPPPTYNEVIGHYPGSTFFQHQQSHGVHSLMGGSRPEQPQNNGLEGTVLRNSKDKKTGHPF
ncbi:protein TMEPAI-like isoform X1 [Leucoraja erinacea]|uniref:protein TMEPAI-like isoform X1 n=1 Tax=Leucoraja erinaceus TaxID=7782 RepID=UPI002454867E|nr:protein TMEPAI-like isoform X1 [Leucoraja erinacea]